MRTRWGVVALGCPAEPLAEFRVGVGGVHHGGFASTGKRRCRATIGDRLLPCGELSGKASKFQPEAQPDAERTYTTLHS
jgi:hypothetical protein